MKEDDPNEPQPQGSQDPKKPADQPLEPPPATPLGDPLGPGRGEGEDEDDDDDDGEITSNVDVFVVFKRERLSAKPLIWRWLARLVYAAIGWSSEYGIEMQAVYTDESEARHAASADGWAYIRVPLNGCLPEETCQYGIQDFPLSEASHLYRRRAFPLVAVPRADIENLALLGEKIEQVHDCIDGACYRAT